MTPQEALQIIVDNLNNAKFTGTFNEVTGRANMVQTALSVISGLVNPATPPANS